jgi:hypothetical protein
VSPLEADLIALMLDEVVIEPQAGIDKFNNFTYGSPVTVACQIVRVNKRALTRSGRELISTVQIILADPTVTVTADARLTLPDGTHPAIIEVLGASDEVGPYYLELRT